MINKKILNFFNKSFFFDYFYRLIITNFFGLIFLYETDSFNQGLISLQSLFYSINSILTILFLVLEFVGSCLQFYGLDYEFIKLTFLDFKSISPIFIYEIIVDILNNIYFIILTCAFIYIKDTIKKNLFNKRLVLFFILSFIFLISLNIDFSKKFYNKIYNFNKSFSEYSFLRNDNWFLHYKYENLIYENKDLQKKDDFISDFSKLIDPLKHNNIFIVINESYPNFKNVKIKENLINYIYDKEMQQSFEINNYITDWSKKYSTQGAELKLFCGTNLKFVEFKNKELKDFINDNNCYFKKFDNLNKIFIHSYKKDGFGRGRYDTFFDQTFFFKDLKNKDLDICEGRPFTAYCDHQLIEKINEFKTNKKNIIIYLTVNNHVPVKLIKNVNQDYCKENFPLNINNQFCFIYQNQILFNQGLKKFINTLSKDDFLIFFSDTPPIFPNKQRIHFEDYIDVLTFKKK